MEQADNTTASPESFRTKARQAAVNLCLEWESVSKYITPSPAAEPEPLPEYYDRKNLNHICKYGGLTDLQELIANGVDIRQNEDEGLRYAALKGHTEIVRLLLKHGADVHVKADNPLRCAVRHGHFEIVRLLLDHGANVHIGDDKPLQEASENNYREIIALLIQFGAPVEILPLEQREDQNHFAAEQLTANKETIQAGKALSEIFNKETWTGHAPEIIELWNMIPKELQSEFDFSHLYSAINHQSLKKHRPRLSLTK